MGRTWSLLALIFILPLSPSYGRGEISPEIQSGKWWRKPARNIGFLEFEKYTEGERENSFYFPNPNTTLGSCALGPVTLVLSQDKISASSLHITAYDRSEDKSGSVTMDVFRGMLDAIKKKLDADLETAGKLSPDKTKYAWETNSGAAMLQIETQRDEEGKLEPKSLTITLARPNALADAVNSTSSNSPLRANKEEAQPPGKKLTREELKAQVKTLDGKVYIEGIKIPGKPFNGIRDLVYLTIGVFEHYGHKGFDANTLYKDLVTTSRQRRNQTKEEALPDTWTKLLRTQLQFNILTLEKLTEGRETTAIIKKCDREAKTDFPRGIYENQYSILFAFPEEILIKVRASNQATNERWFKNIKEQINKGLPIIWWFYGSGGPEPRIIIGYNEGKSEIIYIDSNKNSATIPLANAMAYSIWQMVVQP